MILGVIADDFTGASDAASFLVKGGMRVLLFNGIPRGVDSSAIAGADAVVIALKTRTQEKNSAVLDSVKALKWLEKNGAEHFYVKYCSTFDSTAEGNIGPICDAAMELLAVPYTLLLPSLPVNGRTVKSGILYVNGVKLEDSHMKNHPLTPMRKSHIGELMRPQSDYECRVVSASEVLSGIAPEFREHGYLIPDYETDEDGERIIARFGTLRLLTGGSGILTAWAERLMSGRKSAGRQIGGSAGTGILLAGSCSKATLAQIAWFKNKGGLSYKLDPAKIIAGTQTLADVKEFLRENIGETVLFYSSETADYLEAIRGETLAKYSAALERMTADIAVLARDEGIRHIIVAGGETSGAVTRALGYQSYWIGASIAPGVPMMAPVDRPELRLVLKSGNFGQEDFFGRALTMTSV